MASSKFDVLIIGAGISGINAGYRLQTEFPDRTFLILEARNNLGGTWDLFRYPGIRSDSDLYTFGLKWFPWNQANPIAKGEDILTYLDDAAATHNIRQHIRLNHRVRSANWDGREWFLEVESQKGIQHLHAQFTIFATGYYDYHNPLEAAIPGLEDFQGEIIHPQFWPESFDPVGKKIVVIGSGATAVTLVPSLAKDAQSVTMLQRSPSYLASMPNEVRHNTRWGPGLIPQAAVYRFRRLWFLVVPQLFYSLCQKFPNAARRLLQAGVQSQLPPSIPLDPHFTPRYNPWEQRLCACPDGDFFRALRSTKAQVETDLISQVDAHGIRLASGKRLDADTIITATGLRLQFLGGIPITIKGQKLDAATKYIWNGLMLEGLPNAMLVLGFTNASWTLGADIAMHLTCRILRHIWNNNGYASAVPVVENRNDLHDRPVLDLTSTYVKRAVQEMPRASTQRPWKSRASYFSDLWFSWFGNIKNGLIFSS
ncbi:putative flavoprotein [Aspergillus pseudoustus]|uniref:Flavoprotein n=1 Tax=Aspergillus pseudoustus TaxID=1810923 RepID=A0ABR4IIQ9_9EURO